MGHNNMGTTLEGEAASWPSWASYVTNQQAAKGVSLLLESSITTTKGGLKLPLMHEYKQCYFWNPGHFLGHLLVLPCPTVSTNRKLLPKRQECPGLQCFRKEGLGHSTRKLTSWASSHWEQRKYEVGSEQKGVINVHWGLATSYKNENYCSFACFLFACHGLVFIVNVNPHLPFLIIISYSRWWKLTLQFSL